MSSSMLSLKVFRSLTMAWYIHRTSDHKERKQRRFWATRINRKWTYCNIQQWFAFIFEQDISITSWQLSITNLVVCYTAVFSVVTQWGGALRLFSRLPNLEASRYIKRKNASFPVDVCHSKPPLLKLPHVSSCHLQEVGQFRFLGSSPPIPPLSHHFALSET